MTTEKEEAAPTGIEAAHFKEANQKTKPPKYITKDTDQLAEMALAQLKADADTDWAAQLRAVA